MSRAAGASRDKNYHVRAVVGNEDEIGQLAAGFNRMIEQIVKFTANGSNMDNAHLLENLRVNLAEGMMETVTAPVEPMAAGQN